MLGVEHLVNARPTDLDAQAGLMSRFSDELRRRLNAGGLSLRAAARLVPCDPGGLSRLASGKERCSAKLAVRLDEILHTDGLLVTLAAESRAKHDVDDIERLVQANSAPSRVDSAVVSSLTALLAEQRRIEDLSGSAAVIQPIKAQLSVIHGMANEARLTVRPLVLEQVAEWSQYAGWLTSNTGNRKTADSYFATALEVSEEIGNRDMVATVLSWRGHLAWHAGRIPAMVGLSAASRRDDQVAVAVRAFSTFQEARGLAILKDSAGAHDALARAKELGEIVQQQPDDTPRWCYYYAAPGFFDMQRGMVLRRLGEAPAAADAFAHGIAALPDEMKGSDWAGYFLYEQALAYAAGGLADEAAASGTQALTVAMQTGATGLTQKIKQLSQKLRRDWPECVSVAELGERAEG